MKNLIIAFATAVTASVVLFNQHASLGKIGDANQRLLSQAAVLHARSDHLEDRRASLEQTLSEKQQLADSIPQPHSEIPAPTVVIPPAPDREGGWPTTTPYFYLPKKDLGSVGYRLFMNNRLTDEAATLFGMTAGERELVDAAYDDLWRKFRQLEIEKMQPSEMPARRDDMAESSPWNYVNPRLWTNGIGYVAYYIPSLKDEADLLSTQFSATVGQTLGATRAGYLLDAASAEIAGKLADLGRTARLVGFVQAQERDGTKPFVYVIVNAGINGTTRTINFPLNPESNEAYYARLFGVDVPIEGENPGVNQTDY
jgi:hypothetical protein